jgi:ribosome-binding factor A
MVDAARARKLGERFQEIVAETLEMKVKDPRLGFVTVTSVRVSPDLREATVFYTVFGTEADVESSSAALNSAKGLVRTEIGKRTGIKFTPTVEFIRDALPENVRVIDDLLHVAAKADKELQERAVGARYAGDSDPYKNSDSAAE